MQFNELHISEESISLLIKILFSMALGLIIGLEREHKAKSEAFAGIRTFPLIATLGCISAFVYEKYWNYSIFLTLSGIILFAILNFYFEYKKDKGITTEIAVIITYFIGVLVYYEHYYIAVFLSVSVTILLALKSILENFAKRISQEDIFAILKFFLITVVVYPLLPDKNFGPFEAVNLKDIWKVVIIISSLDFIGYILLKWKGSKVLWINGLVGGLISSTAVTYELSKKSKQYPSLTSSAALGIAAAWTIMNFRVIFLTYVINSEITLKVAIPLVIVSLLFLIFMFYRYSKEFFTKKEENKTVKIGNPFEIFSAIQFAVIYAFILIAVKALKFYLGTKGVYLASFVSGVIDVDAITISLSNLSAISQNKEIFIDGILIAVISNSFYKFIYSYIFGNKELRKDVFTLLIITTVICGGYILI